MRICFLCSEVTRPGSPIRRPDAWEHDLEVAALRSGLKSRGHTLDEANWDSDTDWSMYDAVMIGTTWDYWDRWEDFLSALDNIEAAGVPLFNPAALVRWNSRKTYLRELTERGVPTIPTLWPESPSAKELREAFNELGSDTLIVKRQVGAGAVNQLKLKRGEDLADYPHAAMIQPFVPSIQSEGEYSFVMIDGELSHALIKRAKSGDYRIQSAYGGTEEAVTSNETDLNSAKAVLECLDEAPLYARVDMVRGEDGKLILMELELIEPYLYPEQGPQLGELFAAGLLRRLS